MADPTSSYVKKLKDGTVNQVVNDLWSGMIVMEQQEKYGTPTYFFYERN